MNFDELKSKWDNEDNDDVYIPQNMEKLKKAQHPIDELKGNMKVEFCIQVLAMTYCGFLPYLKNFDPSLYHIFYSLYGVFFLISIYYLYGFYSFYKNIQDNTSATKDKLLELYFELRLNIERYKSWGFLLFPMAIAYLILFQYNTLVIQNKTLADLEGNSLFNEMIWVIVALTLVCMLLIILIANSTYGKYAKQIRRILDQLNED